MNKFKKIVAMFLTLAMVFSTVFVGDFGSISYADNGNTETDDSTIVLPLTIRDAHQDGFLFEARVDDDVGFANKPRNNNGSLVGGIVSNLLKNELDEDNKIVYKDSSIIKLAEKIQSTLNYGKVGWGYPNDYYTKNNHYPNNMNPKDMVDLSNIKNPILLNKLLSQVKKDSKGKYIKGNIPTNPVTNFEDIHTCCDAASWMTYYLFRDGGDIKDNNGTYTYTQTVPEYRGLVLKKKTDGTDAYEFKATRGTKGSAATEDNTDAPRILYKENIENASKAQGGELRYQLWPYCAFLPLNGMSNGSNDPSTLKPLGFGNDETKNNIRNNSSVTNNFGYTLESSGKFIYHKDQNLYFKFNGDDDVYLFINRKLALDLGGTHSAVSGEIYLENTCEQDSSKTWAEYLGLEEGKMYDFNFFYMERHTEGSDLSIETNIRVYRAEAVPQKNAYDANGKLIPYNGIVPANSKITYEFVLTNSGESPITDLTFKDDKLGVTLNEDNITLNDLTKQEDITIERSNKDGTTTKGVYSDLKDMLKTGLAPGEEIKIKGFKYNLGTEQVVNTMSYTAISQNKKLEGIAQNSIVPVKSEDKAFVIDYGKPVTYSYDKVFTQKNYTNVSIGKDGAQESIGQYGTMTNNFNNKNITYTLNKFMNGVDQFVFKQIIPSKDDKGNTYNADIYTNVSMIPATSVYYEDDFGAENNGNPSVSIVWGGKDSNGNSVWKKDGTSQNEKQDSTNIKYGWDSTYEDDTKYSNGSSHWTDTYRATAKFRFTGTAVDVYSTTNKGVGVITARLMRVNKDNSLTGVDSKSIDNQSVSSGNGDYYQIPTLTFDGLEYGTYEVTIVVLPYTEKDGTVRGKYCLDGIRVYNPLNPSKLEPVAADAYKEAGESNAKYISLRKSLINEGNISEITSEIKGCVFIDKSKDKVSDETNSVDTYRDYGPKNEVYLANNHGVAFTVKNYNPETDKVFVGLKSITGKETNVTITGEKTPKSISSASDLYYEVTPDSDGNVLIKNITDNILSVTKVRITTTDTTATTNKTRSLVVSPQLMSYVEDFDNKTETDLDKGDVDIDNPSDNDKEDDNQAQEKPITSLWNKIINCINKWFGR